MSRRKNYPPNAMAKFRKSFAETAPTALRLSDDQMREALEECSNRYDLLFKFRGADDDMTAIWDGKLAAYQVVLHAKESAPDYVMEIWITRLRDWSNGLGKYADRELPMSPKEIYADLMGDELNIASA